MKQEPRSLRCSQVARGHADLSALCDAAGCVYGASGRDQLSTFLEEFADLIDGALTTHPDSLLEQLRDTWKTGIKPAIERIRSSITGGSFDAELEAEGLAGQQLQVKMAVSLCRSAPGRLAQCLEVRQPRAEPELFVGRHRT